MPRLLLDFSILLPFSFVLSHMLYRFVLNMVERSSALLLADSGTVAFTSPILFGFAAIISQNLAMNSRWVHNDPLASFVSFLDQILCASELSQLSTIVPAFPDCACILRFYQRSALAPILTEDSLLSLPTPS
jgi:hypothetical protein